MSTPESLKEDVKFLMKKFSLLDGLDLRALCRELDLPVLNMGGSDMVDQVQKKIIEALDTYSRKPSRESEEILVKFRGNILLKSKFLERYIALVKNSKLG